MSDSDSDTDSSSRSNSNSSRSRSDSDTESKHFDSESASQATQSDGSSDEEDNLSESDDESQSKNKNSSKPSGKPITSSRVTEEKPQPINKKNAPDKDNNNNKTKKINSEPISSSDDEDEEDEEDEDEDDSDIDDDRLDGDEPRTWKHACLLEEQIQLENSLKGNINKQKSKQTSYKKRFTVSDPLGQKGEITHFANDTPGINPNVEGFIPSKYLALVHRNTDTKQLNTGRSSVVKRIEEQTNDMKDLVKNNLSRFIYCKDNVEEIFYSRADKGESTFQGTWLRSIEMNYIEVQRKSKALFDPMIEVRATGEQVKKMCSTLERLDFALSIPSKIEENIRLGEYGKVVQFYRKAKYLMHDAKSSTFQNVYDMILKQISQVRENLFDILKDPLVSYEDKETIIGYLYSLDSEEDPAWFFLNTYHNQIVEALEIEKRRRSLDEIGDDQSWDQLDKDCSTNNSTEENQVLMYSFLNHRNSVVLGAGLFTSENMRRQFEAEEGKRRKAIINEVSRLCDTLIYHIPYFWKHSKTCMQSIDKKAKAEVRKMKGGQKYMSNREQMEHMMKLKREQQSSISEKIDSLFTSIFMTFSHLVSDSLDNNNPKFVERVDVVVDLKEVNSSNNSNIAVLVQCVRMVLNTTDRLRTLLDDIDFRFFQSLAEYADEIREYIIDTLCTNAIRENASLYGNKNWSLNHLDYGTHPNSSTSKGTGTLRSFQKVVENLIMNLKQFVTPQYASYSKLKQYFVRVFVSYADTLHEQMKQICSYSNNYHRLNKKSYKQSNNPSDILPDYKLLLLMTNCNTCVSTPNGLIPSLVSHISKNIWSIRNHHTVLHNPLSDDDTDNDTASVKSNESEISKSPPRAISRRSSIFASPRQQVQKKLRKRISSSLKKLKQDSDSSSNSDSDSSSHSDRSSASDVSDSEDSDSSNESSYRSRDSDVTEEHGTSGSDTDTEDRLAGKKRNSITGKMEDSSLANFQRRMEEVSFTDETKQVMDTFSTLFNILFESYLRVKSKSLSRFIEKGILIGGYDWIRAPTPTQVRSYILELLLDLAQVHYQTDTALKEYTKKIFMKLNEKVAELFVEHVVNNGSVREFSENGALQLEIEIEYLNICMRHYETSYSKQLYRRLRRFVKDQTVETSHQQQQQQQIQQRRSSLSTQDKIVDTKQLKEQIVQEMLYKTRLQFSCFELPVVAPVKK